MCLLHAHACAIIHFAVMLKAAPMQSHPQAAGGNAVSLMLCLLPQEARVAGTRMTDALEINV